MVRAWIPLVSALWVLAAGCGGARSHPARAAGPSLGSTALAYSGDSGGAVAREELLEVDAQVARAPGEPSPRYAQAATQTPEQQTRPTATDAVDTSSPLLVYTATFHLAVYEVRESQARIADAARELGGFVSSQSDDTLVVRVPAPRFHAALEHVERAGDVEHRDVRAQDVSEEFHDVEIRLRNLQAMRARVEGLLAQARTVEEALQVEQQLHRITEELERLRGRQRFLADRVAYSTITVLFRPRPREALEQPEVFELPFGWLDTLGLSNLLDLRS